MVECDGFGEIFLFEVFVVIYIGLGNIFKDVVVLLVDIFVV